MLGSDPNVLNVLWELLIEIFKYILHTGKSEL